MGLVIGIDEAGRGPVLGPMVMAACAIDPKKEAELVSLGVKDSKLLSREKREELEEDVLARCVVKVAIATPTQIDEVVSSKSSSLNKLEAQLSVDLINQILAEHKAVSKVILDCPSTNVAAYRALVERSLSRPIIVVSEHKADFKYPIVAAASIIAKVRRDNELSRISKLVGADLGSGYMTDPKTHAWLQENFDADYGFIRRSWATIKNLQNNKSQRNLFEFEQSDAKKHFEPLVEFGFRFIQTKSPYELIRMKGPENVPVTIIKYTTGKLLVQGRPDAQKKANALLQTVGL